MGRRRPAAAAALDGVVVVDKAAGLTSHDVVARVRRILSQPRSGHAGTLDPDATGVLVIGLGQGTRLLRYATTLEKHYTGEIVLGTTTSTLDAAGEVTGTFPMGGVTLNAARAAARSLTGPILQVPPMVSAVRVGGRRLYEMAREGIEVERAARPVEVMRFDLEASDDPMVLRARVTCSSGTYIRVLAADLGELLGGGAHLRGLRRTAVGSFDIAQARPVDDLTPADILPVASLVAQFAQVVVVDDETRRAIATGTVFDATTRSRFNGFEGDGPFAVTGPASELLAVYEGVAGGRAKPTVVLTRPTGSGPPETRSSTTSPPGRAGSSE